ncbi:MAG: hypothetical protein EPN86_06085 [Nanoarchaeota archaeon]|nr:MAG: hypothetical protein EPN86_06085 [Nanoarchaeota archaeon]
MNQDYTNLQLSRDYMRVAGQNVPDARYPKLLEYQRIIREADVDIAAFYAERGSLQDLVLGNGSLTSLTLTHLEMIISLGVAEAEKEVGEQRIERFRERWKEESPKKHGKKGDMYQDETDPSWQNAVRLREE